MLNLLVIKEMIFSKLIKFSRINKRLVAAAILIFFFLLSRLINLSKLPLFADEAFAILRAREVNYNRNLLGMIRLNTQPVFIWIVAIFQSIPLSLVVSARLVSILAGLITALLLGCASKKFIKRNTFLLAFVITMFLPFSFFYDRTALFESTVLMFMAVSIFAPIVGIPMTILTKQTGWLVLPLSLGLYRRENRKLAGIILVTLFVTFTIWWLAVGDIHHFASTIFRQTQHMSYLINFKNNLLRTKIWLETYLTIPIIMVLLLGLVREVIRVVRSKKISFLTYIGIWMFFILIFVALVARVFYPRYLYPVIIPAVLLAVNGWLFLGNMIDINIQNATTNLILKTFLLSLLFIPALQTDWKIVTDPATAPIALEDHFQFFEDFTSGIGVREITEGILAILYQNGLPLSIYLEDDNSFLVTLLDEKKLKGAKIEIADWLGDPLIAIPDEILKERGKSLFVRNRHPDIPGDWPVELILEVPKTDSRSVYLYRIIK